MNLNKSYIGVLFALAGQAIFSVTRLFSSMAVGGRFGPGSEEQLGIYVAYFSTLLLLVSILDAFVTTPMTFVMPSQPESKLRRFSGHMMVMCLSLNAIVCVGLILFSLVSFGLGLTFSISVLLALTLLTATQLFREFQLRWLLAKLKSFQYSMFELAFFVIYSSVIFVLIRNDWISATTVFLAMAVVNLLVLAAWWIRYRNQFEMRAAHSQSSVNEKTIESENSQAGEFSSVVKNQIVFGKWVAAESVLSIATVYFCQWYLIWKLGAAAAGVYTACLTIVLIANPFLNGVLSVLAPTTAREFSKGGLKALLKTMLIYGSVLVATMMVFSTGLYFGGDWLTTLFFGDRYADYFTANYGGRNYITFLIGLTMPLTGLSYVLACGLMACGLPKFNFFSAMIGFIVIVSTNLFTKETTLVTCAICFVMATAAMVVFRLLAFIYVQSRLRKL